MPSQSASQPAPPEGHALSVTFGDSSPKGGASGVPVRPTRDEQSLIFSGTVVLRCLGQRQLDKERCPEAAALCSKAHPLAPYRALGVQWEVARPANGSPSGSNGDDRRQRRKQGGAVGAAASRMQATAKQTLGAATRAVAMRSIDGEVIPLFYKTPLQTSPRCGIIHLAASPLEIEYLPL